MVGGSAEDFQMPAPTATAIDDVTSRVRSDVLPDLVVADTLDAALEGLAQRLCTRLPDKLSGPGPRSC